MNRISKILRLSSKRERLYSSTRVSNNNNSSVQDSADDSYQTVPYYKQTSSLYIAQSGYKKDQQAVKNPFHRLFIPDINLNELFTNLNCLNENLSARNKLVDTVKLKNDYLEVKKMQNEIKILNAKKSSLTKEIAKFVKANENATLTRDELLQTGEGKLLMDKVRDCVKQINEINEQLVPLDEIVNIAALKLPNKLHTNVPLNENHTLYEYDQCEIYLSEKDINISRNNAILNRWDQVLMGGLKFSFVDFNEYNTDELFMCFMGENYAKLESSINNYFLDFLKKYEDKNNFEYVKGVSMIRSQIVEGCGVHFNDSRKLLNIVSFNGSPVNNETDNNTNIDLLHLCGSSSLYSLVVNFASKKVNKKHLPWLVYTNGRSYTPNNGQRSEFNVLALCTEKSKYLIENDSTMLVENLSKMIKNNVASAVVTDRVNAEFDYENKIKNELKNFTDENNILFNSNSTDEMLIDLLKLLISIFKVFNVRFRLQSIAAGSLKTNESFKVTLDAFVHSEQKFTTVAEVRLLNDFVSRRLQIHYFSQSNDKLSNQYISMIHAKLIDINVFMRCLIESNLQKNGNFIIPNVLEPYFYI